MSAPLLQTDAKTLAELKDLLGRYKIWAELPADEKQKFQAIFLLNAGFFGSHYFEKPDTAFNALAGVEDLDDFLTVKEPPLDQSTVDAALLAQLVEQMHIDQDALKVQIQASHPKSTKETIEMVRRIWLLNQALALRNKINPDLLQQLNEAVDLTTPKETDRSQLRPSIIDEAENIAKFTISTVMDVTTVAPEKIGEATAIIATAAAIFPDYKDDSQTQMMVTDLVVNAVDPNHQTDITKVSNQIRQATITATANDYATALTHPELPIAVDTPNNTATDFAKVVVPEKINIESAETIIAKVKEVDYRYQERVTSITDTTQTISEKFQNLSQSIVIAAALYPALPDPVVAEIVHAAAGIVPDQIRIPTQEGSRMIGFVRAMPANPDLSPAGVEMYARGIKFNVIQVLQKQAQENPNSALAKAINDPRNIRQISQAFDTIRKIELSPSYDPVTQRNFGSDIHQPLTGLSARFQTFTNKITSFLPTRFSTPINFIFHPIASIRSWASQRAGQFIARQFVSRIGNTAVRGAAQFLLKNGVDGALKKLASQVALKAAGKVASQLAIKLAIGSAGGPIGLAVAALLTAGQFLLEKLIKRPDQIAAVPIAAVAALSGLAALPATAIQGVVQAPSQLISTLTAAVTGAVVVASSAAVTMGIATVIALFLYLTAFTAAPLISTLAQLQSGIGPQQSIGGPILPPYTGPILPGCPSSWPIPSGLVIQGPHGSYSHRVVEAIDILTPIGNPVTSLTDGTVKAAGWATGSPAYGNWIKIESTTTGGQKYTIIYAHLSEVRVAQGNAVQAGSVIALSGNTSAVASFANPHLHLEYIGINYNSCPAGGVQIPDGCYGTNPSRANSCTINGRPISF